MQHAPIVEKAYALLKYMLPVLGRLPRDQRFLLGERMQALLMEVLEQLVEAAYVSPAEKRPVLLAVNRQLEKLRFYVRLAYEQGYYNSNVYKDISERIQEVGRMTGGWLKSLK